MELCGRLDCRERERVCVWGRVGREERQSHHTGVVEEDVWGCKVVCGEGERDRQKIRAATKNSRSSSPPSHPPLLPPIQAPHGWGGGGWVEGPGEEKKRGSGRSFAVCGGV